MGDGAIGGRARDRAGSHFRGVGCLHVMKTLIAFSLLLPLAAGTGEQSAPDTGIAARIDRLIRARADADSFSGAVLIARNGTPLLRAAYGLADRERTMPNTVETRFNLGSIDKLITRIAIWQLVAAGKLKLDTPIGTYLPDYPNRDVRERVTARQL